MRTRLQMTPEELRVSRMTMLRSLEDVALWLGARSTQRADLDEALGERYGGWVHIKPAIVPRTEVWEIRFARVPGGWTTAGRMIWPERGPRTPGSKLPRAVRLVLPVRRDGVLPASLAPRRGDLPRVAKGVWSRVSERSRGYPTVRVEASVPMMGAVVYARGNPNGPLFVRFPANKSRLGAAIGRLSRETHTLHRKREEGGRA